MGTTTQRLSLPPRDTAIEQRLGQFLTGARFGQPCYAFEEISSTMDVAHQLAREGAAEGTLVLAQRQTAGRGRAGRTWSSPPGGLYLSLILRPTRPVSEIPQLALVAGLAAAQAIKDITRLSATIRWPNDVFVHEGKVAGILVEARSFSGTPTCVVMGIGINVTTDSKELPEEATSLAQWVTPAPHRFALTASLFRQLEQTYRQWHEKGFAAVHPALLQHTGLFGKLVHITTAQETFEGQATDIDDAGRLLVRLDSGVVRAFDAGEVTLLR